MIERGLLLDPDNLNMCYNSASVYACGLHEPDRALDLLGPTLAKASGTLLRWAEIDPDVDCLREDPRFQAMLAEAKARSSGPMARAASNAGTAT